MDNNTYEKYSSSINVNEFDTDHSGFRFIQFRKYLLKREQEFIGSFRFEGDDNFPRKVQRAFLKNLFRYGYGGVINIAKYSKKKLSTDDQKMIDLMGINYDDIIKTITEPNLAVAVFPFMWDANERPLKATAITAPRHNINKRNYIIDHEDSAMCAYDSEGNSGWWWWLIPAYQTSSADLAIKKRLSLIDAKLVNNKVNNSIRNIKYESVYQMDQSFLDLAPMQSSMTRDNDASDIDIMKMLDTKLMKLDLSNGETINDLLSFVAMYEKTIFTRMGKRVNNNETNNERSITKDFEASEIHWKRLEAELKDQMDIFVEDYKKVFNKDLKVVCLNDIVQEELKQRELALSGRDIDKGKQHAN